MNTTDLFVELIIIGIGALAWLLLFILSVFGFELAPIHGDYSWVVLVPMLSIAYVLGIVVDRTVDTLFEILWDESLFALYYDDRKAFYTDRRLIYTSAGSLTSLMEYGRSRLRISRGWTLNAVMLLISTNLFALMQLPASALRVQVMLFGTCAWSLLALGAWLTWRRLIKNDYRRTKEQAAFLREHGIKPS